MFQFKQFAVDQSGCAMKINTDGVLLGALANAEHPNNILDIGTGTGVIAMMLAQRFESARIDAVEIDNNAADTATKNFEHSSYKDRLFCHAQDFSSFFAGIDDKHYDLMVSNPPFHLNSLKSPGKQRNQARHADKQFFATMIKEVVNHLKPNGIFWMILPVITLASVLTDANEAGLKLVKTIDVSSYPDSEPHRQIVAFSITESYLTADKLVIYQSPKIYTEQYKTLLKDFFTIF